MTAVVVKKRARYVLLTGLCLLLEAGVAEAVKVELDTASSTSTASTSVKAYSIAKHELADDVYFEESNSWSGSGTQYEGLAQAYQSHSPSSVAASVSVSSGSLSAYPETGEQSIEGRDIYDVRFYADCIAWPFIPDPESGLYTIHAGFDCKLNAEGSIVWELLPSTKEEQAGTQVIVSFRPGFSLGGQSGGTVYEFKIFEWEYGIIGKDMEGPYEISNYADPPDYGKTPVPDWEDLEIHASIGDKIILSYKMEGIAYTQDPSMGSNLNPVDENPTMNLSLKVWAEILPDLIGQFGITGHRYPPDPGANHQAEVELFVTNIGAKPTEPKQKIDMEFFLRPVDSPGDDIIVSTLQNVLIGKLAPGASKRMDLSVPLSIPAFTNGTFILGVYIDSSDKVEESNEENNIAITTDWYLTIYEGTPVFLPDLEGEFVKVSFRNTQVRTEIDIINSGIVNTLRKQLIDIGLCIRPCTAIDDSDDVSIKTFVDQQIGNLRPGNSKTLRFTFNMPPSGVIDAGEYKFVAKIDSSEDVAELNETNNEALSECFIIE
jgi:hypothetical protein